MKNGGDFPAVFLWETCHAGRKWYDREERCFFRGEAVKKIRLQYNSPVILTFALLSLGALLLGELTEKETTWLFFSVYRAPLSDLLTYLRFFLHVLGHASYDHYIGNMLLLLVIGPPLEEKYGSRNILLAITVTALVTGLVEFIFFPREALLGASGVVFMLIILSSLSGRRGDGIPITLLVVIVLYLGREIVSGIFERDNISQLTHILGGVCGLVLGMTALRKKR